MLRAIKQTINVQSVSNAKTRLSFPCLATFFRLALFKILFWAVIFACPPPAMAGSSSYRGQHVGLSMRVLAQKAYKSSSARDSLCGVSKLEGFVVDRDNQDIIIIGRKSSSHPNYHLDDLVVNVRTIWDKSEALYCSLDPRPQDVRNVVQILSENTDLASLDQRRQVVQQVEEIWGSQSVRIGGIPRDSRHAHIMIDADYHMKKVSLDLIQLPGISSYLARKASQGEAYLRQGEDMPGSEITINRFWFHIKDGYPTFTEADGIFWLEACPVVLFTAKQNATQTGELYDAQEDDLQAVAFAENFSNRFKQAKKRVPSYAGLENLYRLRALLQVMYNTRADATSGLDMGFYLNKYRYQMERSMPDSLPGLVNYKETHVDVNKRLKKWSLPLMYGGVNMEMDITERQFRADAKLNKMRKAVIKARPASDALTWIFRF